MAFFKSSKSRARRVSKKRNEAIVKLAAQSTFNPKQPLTGAREISGGQLAAVMNPSRQSSRVWSSQHPIIRLSDLADKDVLRPGAYVIEGAEGHCLDVASDQHMMVEASSVGFDIVETKGHGRFGKYLLTGIPFDEAAFRALAETTAITDPEIQQAKAALEALSHD